MGLKYPVSFYEKWPGNVSEGWYADLSAVLSVLTCLRLFALKLGYTTVDDEMLGIKPNDAAFRKGVIKGNNVHE